MSILWDQLFERIEKQRAGVEKAVRAAVEEARQDFAEQIAHDALGIARDAIGDFYGGYSPRSYDRRGSLYDVPEIHASGTVVSVAFEPEVMTFRDGYGGEDGLYDQVFREGWHGGADKGPEHPSPGTPYWRAGKNFSKWGRPAAIAPISPLEDIRTRFRDYNRAQMPTLWRGIVSRRVKEHIEGW